MLHLKEVKFFILLMCIGVIMTVNSFAGTGRGDFHTLYRGQSVDDLIIQYMEANNVPGMALAIVQAPYITRVVGYGIADLQSKRLVGTHTVFLIGQLTNAFTAVAIMQLKEEGKLKLEDAITKYLTTAPQTWSQITIRDLMAHTSGLASYMTVKNFDCSKSYQAQQIIEMIKDEALLFAPGTQANQSPTDAYLLGLIIEKASGMSYQDYVTKNQIERIPLRHTYFIANTNKIKNEVNNQSQPFKHSGFLQDPMLINPTELASGYAETNGKLSLAKKLDWSTAFAESGIVSSAEDISMWDIGLAGGILVKDAADREFLYHSVKLQNGQTIPANAGWFFPGHKGLMEIKGNVPGYSAFLSRFTDPNELLCVTLLANKEGLVDLDLLARKVAAAFDNQLGTPTGAPWSQTLQSPYPVAETLDRVAAIIKAQGGTIFARVDHSGEAQKANLKLEPTQVLIIGNPAKGTGLMQAKAAIALDLPLRIMATQDTQGQVWLSFTDPVLLGREYEMDPEQMALLKQMSVGLRKICEKAISPYQL